MSTLVGGTTTVSIIQGLPSARGGSGGGGGGGVASCATFANGDIAFYTAATTLGCNDQLQWDNTNNHQYTGDPQSSFTAGFQNYLGTKSMKQWDAGVAVAGANFTGLFVQEEGTTTEPIGIYVATRSQDQNIIGINSDLNGNVAMGQTVPLGVNINLGSGWIGPGSVTLHKDIVASPNYSGGVIVGESNGYWGNSVVVGPTTAITNNYDFHSAMDTVSAGGTITNNYAFAAGNHGGTATTFSAAFFADTQTSADGHSWAFYNASGKSKFNLVTLDTLSTGTNCAANGTAANPSIVACGAASAGMFSCATAATTGTCQVNTTAVTANSEIFITQDAADGGAGQLNVTCNTALVTPAAKPILLSKNAGTSFTINLGTVSVNPGCFQFQIIN
jgi:hypothetical protein